MKKFRFTMQTLLNVKLTLEKQHKAEIAECAARIRRFEAEQQENFDLLSRQRGRYKLQLAEGMPAAEVKIWRGSFLAMRECIERQAAKIETAEDERRRIERKLIEIMKERKMLEKLREKQLEEYGAEQRAEDAAIIDDFMSHKSFAGGMPDGG